MLEEQNIDMPFTYLSLLIVAKKNSFGMKKCDSKRLSITSLQINRKIMKFIKT